MPRRTREDFDQDFLDAVAVAPDERTPQQIADTHIDRRQKRKVKDYYPIYSDNPAQWQADLMFLPYTNAKNETRLHAIFCVININNKYAFARVLPFTAKRGVVDTEYNPSEPLDETGERGVNINGQRYEVKVKGQAYSQAKVVSAFRAILDVDVPKETQH